MASQGPFDLNAIISTVRSFFQVTDETLREDGSVEFAVAPSQTLKKDFEKLIRTLKPYGYLAVLTELDGGLNLRVGRMVYRERRRAYMPLLLLAATITTVGIDGYFRTPTIPGFDTTATILLYVAGIMGIIGVHELCHKIAAYTHGMRSSPPYFIPGVPSFLPTFGAFISTRDPPINRDSLFDLGISGPIGGLAATFLVGIGGALTALAIPESVAMEAGARSVTVDLFTDYLLTSLAAPPPGQVLILSPLTFAATLGFLITFLNLLPAWQLDGGHIANAALSRRQHRFATFTSIILLIILGFTIMALFILILSLQTPEARPLDSVSNLSSTRKLIFLGVVVLAVVVYFFTLVDNPFFTVGFRI